MPLKKHIVSLLVKNSLSPIEIETMKQVASNVINFVKDILSDEQAKELKECSALDEITFGLDLPTIKSFDEKVDKCYNVHMLLGKTLQATYDLLLLSKRNSDQYLMTKVIHYVSQNVIEILCQS